MIIVPTTTEAEVPEESSEATEGPRIDSPATGHDGGSPPSHSATQPEPGESEDEDRSDGSFLLVSNTGGPGYGHGATVEDRQGKRPQWRAHTNHTVGL